MAQSARLPSTHSVHVFGGDTFLVKYLQYFVSVKSTTKRVEHNQHCFFKSFSFFSIYTH